MDPLKINNLLTCAYPDCKCVVTSYSSVTATQPVYSMSGVPSIFHMPGRVEINITYNLCIPRNYFMTHKVPDIRSLSVSNTLNSLLISMRSSSIDFSIDYTIMQCDLVISDVEYFMNEVQRDINHYYDQQANEAIEKMLTES